MFRNYQETIDYLYSCLPMFQRVGAVAYKPSLDNIRALCQAIGNPHEGMNCIHIAGTNGKGSSSHFTAAILQAAGYKTGLYTSPHLKSFTERIRVNGQPITEEAVVAFVNTCQPAIEQLNPSFFEITVAMAFWYFSRERIHWAVIEVGLGGRLDSTNIIYPQCCLITNIGWDHMDLLGNTLPAIAAEKAGIMKPGTPVVISEYQPEVEPVFRETARQQDAPLLYARELVHIVEAEHGLAVHFLQQGKRLTLHPDLKGAYQRKNLAGVLAMIGHMRDGELLHLSDDNIQQGVAECTRLTGLKGRWQLLGEQPRVFCDVGHNEDGMREVLQQIATVPHERLVLIIGMVSDKDHSAVLDMLPRQAGYYFCTPSVKRGLAAEKLAEKAAARGLQGEIVPDVNMALKQATAKADPNDLIVVCGSTFLVADIDNL